MPPAPTLPELAAPGCKVCLGTPEHLSSAHRCRQSSASEGGESSEPEPVPSWARSELWWHLPRVPREGRRGASTHHPVWQLLLSNPNRATTASWRGIASRPAPALWGRARGDHTARLPPGRCRCPALHGKSPRDRAPWQGTAPGGCAVLRCVPSSAIAGGRWGWGQLCTSGNRGALGPCSPPPSSLM